MYICILHKTKDMSNNKKCQFKPNEVRAGSIVKRHGVPIVASDITVWNIAHGSPNYEPVNVSESALEFFGFRNNGEGWDIAGDKKMYGTKFNGISKKLPYFAIYPEDGMSMCVAFAWDIRYVHELQDILQAIGRSGALFCDDTSEAFRVAFDVTDEKLQNIAKPEIAMYAPANPAPRRSCSKLCFILQDEVDEYVSECYVNDQCKPKGVVSSMDGKLILTIYHHGYAHSEIIDYETDLFELFDVLYGKTM